MRAGQKHVEGTAGEEKEKMIETVSLLFDFLHKIKSRKTMTVG